ncbi:MAG: rhomboid family intramembrane serine protease [Deltaproteobacteria bacterium]|nr:rhomboid family intramembrane serine protease [Deltaproteobacteria bacterium]
MPTNKANFSFNLGSGGVGPVTKILLIAILVLSLGASIGERKFGFGISMLDFRIDNVLAGELWRLVTYPFVEGSPFGLILSMIVLWFFGNWFEQRWGARDYIRFFAISSIGAALLAIPLSYIFNFILPFTDLGVAQGPDAALDAMLVAMAFSSADSKILFGFILPMRAKTLVFLLLGIVIIFGIQTGAATLSIHVGGMIAGYLLVTGKWRPSYLISKIRRQQKQRRSRGLYVVPPRDRTLN